MKTRTQYAALPFVKIRGRVRILLITRRRSRRWIIPKGWPEKAMSGAQVAALEAFEEAGVKGRTGKKPAGRFTYTKKLDDGAQVLCDVEVWPLRVKMQYLDWPEKGQREMRWLKPGAAAALVEQQDLSELLLTFARQLKKKAKLKKKAQKKLKKIARKNTRKKAARNPKIKTGLKTKTGKKAKGLGASC